MEQGLILRATNAVAQIIAALFLLYGGSLSAAVPNTIIEFDTSLGSFQVELFDSAAPNTVANFVSYVSSGRYTDSFIHRSVPGFIVQGGGYTFASDAIGAAPVVVDPPIANESSLSNLRGTIAMARLERDPNSATSQWFINLADNVPDLDTRNFTVFGKITGTGMDVIDAIAALPRLNAGSPFETLPVNNYVGGAVLKRNLVVIDSVRIVPEPTGIVLATIGTLLTLTSTRACRS